MTKDRVLVIGMLIFISIMFWESFNIPEKTNWQVYGSAFYPRILLGVLTFFSFLLLVISFFTKQPPKREEVSKQNFSLKKFWEQYSKVIFLFVFFFIYVYIMPMVGFVFATLIYLFTSQALLMGIKNRRKIMINLSVTLIATFSVFFTFNYGLNVWLP